MELLRTDRLILRRWQEDDEDRFIHIASQNHIAYWLSDWGGCSQWASNWIKGTVAGYTVNDPMIHFMTWAIVLKESGKLIGMINIGSDEYGKKEVGTGYFIDLDYTNNGYMTEALKALCAYVFRIYGYDHIALMVQPDNYASIAVAQKAGFQYIEDIMSDQVEKIISKYHDNIYFSFCENNSYKKFLSKPNSSNAKDCFKTTSTKGTLWAYKLFYVGCSRARKELVVLVDSNIISNFANELIAKMNLVGFETT